MRCVHGATGQKHLSGIKRPDVAPRIELMKTGKRSGHGTEISALTVEPVDISAEGAKEILGSGFL